MYILHTHNHLIYIQNHGERGVLLLELTNYYFVNEEKRSEIRTNDFKIT
jgi:hypothetical protein